LSTVVLLICVGCGGSDVIWSAESRSPGEWIATARTVQYDGFGNNGVETTVRLKRVDGSGSPERVLAFDEAGPDIDLKMHWDGPTHLVVSYKSDRDALYYWVALTYGVTISARNVSPHPEQEYRPSANP
jgi:hypothetical protein